MTDKIKNKEKNAIFKFICINCGIVVGLKDVAGSMKHPYCKPCFKEIFNNDLEKYNEFVNKTHGY